MNVRPEDGCCRSCGGPLQVIDADDATMTVACAECSDTYEVEVDAFGDGAMDYIVDFLARHPEEGADGPERDPA